MKKLRILIVLLCCILCGCNKYDCKKDGDTFFINDATYNPYDGAYSETNNKLGSTDGWSIYEIEGDKEHHYIVARSFLDQYLYKDDSFTPTYNKITGYYVNGYSHKEEDEEGIALMEELVSIQKEADQQEIIVDDIYDYGKLIYITYDENIVGDYVGILFEYEDKYYLAYDLSNPKKVMASIVSKEYKTIIKRILN